MAAPAQPTLSSYLAPATPYDAPPAQILAVVGPAILSGLTTHLQAAVLPNISAPLPHNPSHIRSNKKKT